MPPTRAELQAQLDEREAEPVMVPAAIAAPVMAASALLFLAVLYQWAQRVAGEAGTFSPYWLILPSLLGWAVAHFEGAGYFVPQLYGYAPREWARILAATASAGGGGWLVWTGQVGPGITWPYLLMGTAVVTLLWSTLLWSANRRLRDPAAPHVDTPGNGDKSMPWASLIDRAGDGKVVITDEKYHRAGVTLTVEPGQFEDEVGQKHDEDVTFTEFSNSADRFAALAAKEYRRRTGERMPPNCARSEQGRDDAEFFLHVTMRDVFGGSADYIPSPHARSIEEACDLGEYEDASRIMISLLSGHARIVGMTGCIAAETRIYLPETGEHVRVDTLTERGESVTVLAWDEGKKEFIHARTDGAPYIKGTAELFEVTCSDGATMRVTRQHRFLTPAGWRQLSEVRIGHLLAAAPRFHPEVGDHGSRFGGRVMGDELALATESTSVVELNCIEWNRVRSIRPIGRAAYYDLSVPGPENYVAEGMVNHNSGKSVEINNWIGRITECSNALAWVCATDKLIPLIWPWLRSFFAGATPLPALDYVAGLDIQNVLGMLADAYKLCCERNARLTDESKMKATSDEPAVFVFLEEMSHTMEFRGEGATIETHDGIVSDASNLIMLIARAGRSANVRLVLISQTALNSSGGDSYAEIIRNCQIRVCLKTMEAHDGGRTIPALNNVDTTLLPLHTKIVQPSIEVTRAMPGKAPFLDGTAAIGPLATRNATWRPQGVESDSRLGKRYEDRWNPERHPELVRAVKKHGLEWRVPRASTPKIAPREPWNIIQGGRDSHPEGGTAVDTWTDADDDALTDLLGRPGDDAPPRAAGGFQIPNGDAELARMAELAADLLANPPRFGDEADPGEDERPLPSPLAEVIEWFDEQEKAGSTATFYLTETIARGIDYDQSRLSTEINRLTKIRTRNAWVHEDRQKRKGYDVAALREAATRIRFEL